MMEWRDEGVLLSVRRHGESAAIIEVFTAQFGRHAGVVRGGAGRRLAPVLQPGAQLAIGWRARLDAHIGTFSIEPIRQRMGAALGDPVALEGLASVCALLARCLPERAAEPALYATSCALLDRLGATGWAEDYVRWEIALLEVLGQGLDLSSCAITGARDGLTHVSPRTGRAVQGAAAAAWADRLLPLPGWITDGSAAASSDDLAAGFALTGHFLDRALAALLGEGTLPEARRRLAARAVRAWCAP
jgi:DNA repair protein RecO (recombination protein O)